MKNYPIFTPPDAVWTDIIHRTSIKTTRGGILSRARYIKKVGFSIGIFAFLFVLIGIFYTQRVDNKLSTATYFGYINEIDSLTKSMDTNLDATLIQINQL